MSRGIHLLCTQAMKPTNQQLLLCDLSRIKSPIEFWFVNEMNLLKTTDHVCYKPNQFRIYVDRAPCNNQKFLIPLHCKFESIPRLRQCNDHQSKMNLYNGTSIGCWSN